MNKVYVVGLGPGGEEFMTAQARAAMERADVLCGYTVYVDLVSKKVSPFSDNMKDEFGEFGILILNRQDNC